jgi:hypothetical protein
LKVVRETKQTTYKGKLIKFRADFSTETLKARRAWCEVFQAQNENNFNPKLLYPEKLSFKIDGAIKVFHDKQKLKQYMTTKPPLQKILQGILTQKVKPKITMKPWQAVPNYWKRKSKEVESNIDLATHNQSSNN